VEFGEVVVELKYNFKSKTKLSFRISSLALKKEKRWERQPERS
jgi:hypothetical protein